MLPRAYHVAGITDSTLVTLSKTTEGKCFLQHTLLRTSSAADGGGSGSQACKPGGKMAAKPIVGPKILKNDEGYNSKSIYLHSHFITASISLNLQ